jgi:hypothetical protein
MLIIVDFPFALLMPIRRVNNYVRDDFDYNMIIVIISCEYKLILTTYLEQDDGRRLNQPKEIDQWGLSHVCIDG